MTIENKESMLCVHLCFQMHAGNHIKYILQQGLRDTRYMKGKQGSQKLLDSKILPNPHRTFYPFFIIIARTCSWGQGILLM